MRERRYGRLIGAALVVTFVAGTWSGPAEAAIRGAAWILLNADTGTVLSESHADDPLPPASLAKMLTALVVRDGTQLEERVTISEAATNAREDRLRWPKGFTFTAEQVLYGLLLESSNGAGIALAEHVSGSQRAFAELMNEKARSLGATHSTFVNPHGLDAPGQLSTARDLVAVSRAVLADKVLGRIVHTARYEVPWLGGVATFHNSNRFLATYPGSIGVKPGFTSIAGNCLAAAATRNGNTLVAVVLNSVAAPEDAAALMDAAFARLPRRAGRNDPQEPAPVALVTATEAKEAATSDLQPVALTATAAALPRRPADSRIPSIPGTALVLLVTFLIARKRSRERMLARRSSRALG